MKILLINPKFPESFWSFKWAIDTVLPNDIRAVNPPLGLATLAALSPEETISRPSSSRINSPSSFTLEIVSSESNFFICTTFSPL